MEIKTSELDEFREKWREEVSARGLLESDNGPSHSTSEESCRNLSPISYPSDNLSKLVGTGRTIVDPVSNLEPDDIGKGDIPTQETKLHCPETLATALDHYELAVKRENDGILGESLDLYRKAFRMDHRVDRKYKNKYFPTERSTTTSSTKSKRDDNLSLNFDQNFSSKTMTDVTQLIESFSGLSIQTSIKDDEEIAPPCPLASLPDEILIGILKAIAILDIASFVRIALVCKKLAYLVATEQQIWKRICIGSEFGFGAMHYEWQSDNLEWPFHRQNTIMKIQNKDMRILSRNDITEILLHKYYSSSWYEMFRLRPRIRFNGCYISTVNYLRPGEASTSQVSWNSPILIVTYYRFLRFFRDGTVISLLTTNEPVDVVPFLTKENLEIHRNGSATHLPSKVMQKALRGRWHLGKYSVNYDTKNVVTINDESYVFLETEGINDKYIYQLKLSLRNSNKARKNNKLIWHNFTSLNRITSEIDQFCLKDEKPFFWSRVKSYEN